jgi:hypothetical protein
MRGSWSNGIKSADAEENWPRLGKFIVVWLTLDGKNEAANEGDTLQVVFSTGVRRLL